MQNKFKLGDKVVNKKSCMVFYCKEKGGFIKDSSTCSKFVGSVINGELVVHKFFLVDRPTCNRQEYFYTCGDALGEEFDVYLWESEMMHHPFYGSGEENGGVFDEDSYADIKENNPPLSSLNDLFEVWLEGDELKWKGSVSTKEEKYPHEEEEGYLTEEEIDELSRAEDQKELEALGFEFESDVVDGTIEFVLEECNPEVEPEVPTEVEPEVEDSIYDLELHETLRVDTHFDRLYITRVPSGWIYNTENGDTFVPDVRN